MPTQEEIEAMRKATEAANLQPAQGIDLVVVQRHANQVTFDAIAGALGAVRRNRPGDRSELDRAYAVLITDLEKAAAYCKVYVVGE